MRRTATNLKYGRGCAYDIQYHIIFVTKYRRNVLTKQIRQECIDLMRHLSADSDYSIIEANGEEDHIHLLIEATPLTDIPSMIKQLKGVTARLLFKNHPRNQETTLGRSPLVAIVLHRNSKRANQRAD